MANSKIKEKLHSYFNNSQSKVFDGLSYSSDSLFIYEQKYDKKLVIVKNNNEGERIYKEIKFYEKDDDEKEIIFIPGTEEMPYDMVNSDKYLSSSKNLNLIKLINSKSKYITVITTIKNLKKKLIPKEILINETILLKEGLDLNINNLKENLSSIGYINNPQVNFQGEFSIRGAIIDIFPGGYQYPIRIDLNDIQIETIKYFNTETQISYDNLQCKKIFITPINNIICRKSNIINFRKKFRELFEGNPNNNEIYTNISNNIIPQGFNNFFPLLFENTNNIFDYLQSFHNIFIYDAIYNQINDYNDQIDERFEDLTENGEKVLSKELLYTKNNLILDEINKKKYHKNLQSKNTR